MTYETLNDVRIFVQELVDNDVRVSINFIGGEPTLNLNEFERCLNALGHLQNYNCDFQMTTNGWWLKKPEATRKFLSIIAPYVSDEPEESINVRISQDEFHDEFRPNHLQGKGLDRALESIWEDKEIFYKDTWLCDDCGKDGEGYKDECHYCESENVCNEVREMLSELPEPNPNHPWIYVQKHSTFVPMREMITPQGRGANVGTGDKGKGQGTCTKSGTLTFTADGTLSDVCCMGSNCPMGTIKDHPYVLLAMAKRFGEEAKPNCWECQDQFLNWKIENPNLKDELQKELEKTIEMLECA